MHCLRYWYCPQTSTHTQVTLKDASCTFFGVSLSTVPGIPITYTKTGGLVQFSLKAAISGGILGTLKSGLRSAVKYVIAAPLGGNGVPGNVIDMAIDLSMPASSPSIYDLQELSIAYSSTSSYFSFVLKCKIFYVQLNIDFILPTPPTGRRLESMDEQELMALVRHSLIAPDSAAQLQYFATDDVNHPDKLITDGRNLLANAYEIGSPLVRDAAWFYWVNNGTRGRRLSPGIDFWSGSNTLEYLVKMWDVATVLQKMVRRRLRIAVQQSNGCAGPCCNSIHLRASPRVCADREGLTSNGRTKPPLCGTAAAPLAIISKARYESLFRRRPEPLKRASPWTHQSRSGVTSS